MPRQPLLLLVTFLIILSAKLDAQTSEDYFHKGLEEEKADHLGLAIANYDQSIALNPRYAPAYTHRGLLKLNWKKDLAGAMLDFEEVVILNPSDPFAFNNLGYVKQKLDDFDGAMTNFNHAIILKPDCAWIYDSRADLKLHLSDPEGAMADCNQAINLNQKIAKFYITRGIVKAVKNDLVGTLADCDLAIALNPNDAHVYSLRGIALDACGDFAKAESAYLKSISLNPKLADYDRFQLALVLRRQNADESAADLSVLVTNWENGWRKTVGLFVTGFVTESDLLSQSKIGNSNAIQKRQCEAFYYAGMAHLIKGEKEEARFLFLRCIKTEMRIFKEYTLATAELARLNAHM